MEPGMQRDLSAGERRLQDLTRKHQKKGVVLGDAALPGWWDGAGTSIPVSPLWFGPREAQRLPFSQVLLFATQQRNKNESLPFKIKGISVFMSFFSCCQKSGQGDGLNNCFSGKCNLTLLFCSALPFLGLILMIGRRTQKLLWHTREQFMLSAHFCFNSELVPSLWVFANNFQIFTVCKWLLLHRWVSINVKTTLPVITLEYIQLWGSQDEGQVKLAQKQGFHLASAHLSDPVNPDKIKMISERITFGFHSSNRGKTVSLISVCLSQSLQHLLFRNGEAESSHSHYFNLQKAEIIWEREQTLPLQVFVTQGPPNYWYQKCFVQPLVWCFITHWVPCQVYQSHGSHGEDKPWTTWSSPLLWQEPHLKEASKMLWSWGASAGFNHCFSERQ